jgi:hypothetical protein
MLHDPHRRPPPTLQDLVATLRSAGIFSRLTDAQLLTLARRTRLVSLAAGEALFRHGDKARALYLLVQGQLKLYRASAAGDEVIIDLLAAWQAPLRVGFPRRCFSASDIGPNGETRPRAVLRGGDGAARRERREGWTSKAKPARLQM